MGQAMAATLLKHGHPTTVWNRTPGKADHLIANGATAAGTVAEAVAASQLVIVCVLDYDAVRTTVEPVADTLTGRTLVNLTTGAPEQARQMAAWAGEHGIEYLDGALMTVPQNVGGPEALVLYSGAKAAFETHRQTLELVGVSRFLGEDAGLAGLHDLALLALMYATLAGYYHATALVGAVGVAASDFAALVVPAMTGLVGMLPDNAKAIDSRTYTDFSSLDLNKIALDKVARISAEHGIRTDVIAPIQRLVDGQIAEGHGGESLTRLIEAMR